MKNKNIGKWDELVNLLPDKSGLRLKYVFSSLYRDGERTKKIDEIVGRAEDTLKNLPNYEPLKFLRYFVLDCPPDSPVKRVLEAVRSWKEHVETAYLAPKVVAPTGGVPNPQQKNQGYLKPAPLGIGAEDAWQHPGGEGQGQELVDLEGGWMLDHEDLVGPDRRGQPVPRKSAIIYGKNIGSCERHGTQVLGVICARDNLKGGKGIVANLSMVDLASHSDDSINIPEAIMFAAAGLTPRGVLLLETSFRWEEGGPIQPAELDPLVFKEIQLATAAGYVVVEAAGNGALDLDRYVDERIRAP